MVIIPKGKLVLSNLNSYYLKVDRLVEHFQGELGSGQVYFNSSNGKGTIYFTEHEVLGGYFQQKGKLLFADEALRFLLNPPEHVNFSISIFSLDAEEIYYWLHIPTSTVLHDNLSSEFTDFENLLKKMTTERLTGYVEAMIPKEKVQAHIFFKNGQIIENYYSWAPMTSGISRQNMATLIQKIKEYGGNFKVYQISFKTHESMSAPSIEQSEQSIEVILKILSELFIIFEQTVNANRRGGPKFITLLKKKFLKKADKYAFLDPFAGEFDYSKQKIHFTGDAGEQELISAVNECLSELADELKLRSLLRKNLSTWSSKYSKEIKRFAIKI